MASPHPVTAADLAAAWAAVRETRPLVQCLTNVVSVDLMANSLLAAGASPAMVSSAEEAGDFAASPFVSAVLVNLGTLSPAGLAGQHAAVDAANAAGKPWVLDPVACGATPYRTAAAVALARKRPALVRGNASEVTALAVAVCGASAVPPGDGAGQVRGVDSTLASADAAAAALAAELGAPVAVSGKVDAVVLPSGRAVRVHGGVAMLADITATGCSVTALCAAAVGAAWSAGGGGGGGGETHRTAVAAAAALAAFGKAAEAAVASGRVHGPASLRVALVDALADPGVGEFGAGVVEEVEVAALK